MRKSEVAVKKYDPKMGVLYARVSSKEQEEEGYSIPAQIKLLESYAEEKGIRIVERFVEVESAKVSGRTEFSRMIDFLGSNSHVKIVLAEKTDRLYRNFRDYVELEKLNLVIHFVKEHVVFSKDSNSQAKLFHGFKVLLAKNYVDNLGEEVMKGMKEKAEEGIWPCKAPIGYLNDRRTRTIEPDPERAHLVRKLFELYANETYSLSSLAEAAYKMGLRTKTGRRLSKGGVEWILKNPLYFGRFVFKGRMHEGSHVPLITKELFDQVQQRMSRGLKQKTQQELFIFRGKIVCERCGCLVTGQIKENKYIYYHCAQGKGPCKQPYVRQQDLDSQFALALSKVVIDDEVKNWVIEALQASHADEREYRESRLKALQEQYDRLQRRLDSAYLDKLDGTIRESQYAACAARWHKEQDDCLGSLQKLQNANRNYVDDGRRILELAQNAHSLYVNSPESEKRRLIEAVLSKSILDGTTLCVTYNKPFDLILESNEAKEKLPRLDSNQRPAD